jgi:hypothetical protein
MAHLYTLRGHKPVPCADVLEWGRWIESADRHVGSDYLGTIHVSTVFLGLNHQFGNGRPMLFETMIFGGPLDQYTERYSTWDEAEAGHRRAVNMMRERMPA